MYVVSEEIIELVGMEVLDQESIITETVENMLPKRSKFYRASGNTEYANEWLSLFTVLGVSMYLSTYFTENILLHTNSFLIPLLRTYLIYLRGRKLLDEAKMEKIETANEKKILLVLFKGRLTLRTASYYPSLRTNSVLRANNFIYNLY